MDSARPDSVFDPYPDPVLLAQDVVRIQLDALQNNDLLPDNLGLRIAYRFASPADGGAFGAFEEFVRMLRNALHQPLIGFERAELGLLRVSLSGELAAQQVWVYRHGRSQGVFRWVLARQAAGDYAGCWMVDAIIRSM